MTGKIHVFPFSNDLYVMFDLLLLLLLAHCKTLWYHLYARIIMTVIPSESPASWLYFLYVLPTFFCFIYHSYICFTI